MKKIIQLINLTAQKLSPFSPTPLTKNMQLIPINKGIKINKNII
jgi:hypothetical protein